MTEKISRKKISAQIIADSKNGHGNRITTFVLTFPRFILAELNTHRMFSRNSASSRAIPFKKMVKMVEEDPFIPIAWQKDHKGMQGTEYFDRTASDMARRKWLIASQDAVQEAQNLSNLGVTKQLCNRLLEPFMWHTAIVTATEFENFFILRCPRYYDGMVEFRSVKDYLSVNDSKKEDYPENYFRDVNKGQGEIHIMALAEAMSDAMNESVPKMLKSGEWHIPFGDRIDEDGISKIWSKQIGENTLAVALDQDLPYDRDEDMNSLKIKIATARCARVSYLNFEGKDDYEADIKLHDILLESGHFSPFEHCAKAMSEDEFRSHYMGYGNTQHNELQWDDMGWSGNFRGFIQYRKMLE